MDWTFTTLDIFRVGILIYVGCWVYARIKSRKAYNSPEFTPQKYEPLYNKAKNIKKFGWIYLFLAIIFLGWLFPSVYIVTQAAPEANDSLSVRKSFSCKKKLVPFIYKGEGCVPFRTYLSNETDSSLVLYQTKEKGGNFTYVSDEKDFKNIPAHSFSAIKVDINNRFSRPSAYYPGSDSKKKEPQEHEMWTLDLRQFAKEDCEYISTHSSGDNPYNINALELIPKPTPLPDSVIVSMISKYNIDIEVNDDIKYEDQKNRNRKDKEYPSIVFDSIPSPQVSVDSLLKHNKKVRKMIEEVENRKPQNQETEK